MRFSTRQGLFLALAMIAGSLSACDEPVAEIALDKNASQQAAMTVDEMEDLEPPLPPRMRGMSGMGSSSGMDALPPEAGVLPLLALEAEEKQLSNTAKYATYSDNVIKQTAREPLTIFNLDVDTASYTNIRHFLREGRKPGSSTVRVEELINYFPADKADQPLHRLESSPFEAAYELAPSPWNKNNVLLSLTLKAIEMDFEEAPPANLVFLVDVSGSMYSPERLPLVQDSLKLLVENLRPQDKISLVTYAGGTSVVLQATPGSETDTIIAAIHRLTAGGAIVGGVGLKLAYQEAERGFIKGGINRILLCTDGDFNLGVSSQDEVVSIVTHAREKGVTLSILRFGADNLNDSMMKKIVNVGDGKYSYNGNYSYIDSVIEARKVLSEEMGATLITVAKDVKAQIEFNPAQVLEYRQIGYEKRQLRNADFNNDKIDAGDIGSGKRVTVLYELTLAGSKPSVDALRYAQNQPKATEEETASTEELAFVKLRWKAPTGDTSEMVSLPVVRSGLRSSFEEASSSFRFFAAVAAYGQKLRNTPYVADLPWQNIAAWAKQAKGSDPGGYRAEFVKLIGRAARLDPAARK